MGKNGKTTVFGFCSPVLALAMLLSANALSGDVEQDATAEVAQEELYENHCRDQASWDNIDDLLKKVPNDQLVIRSYAMRLGICRLIAEKKISLKTGIQVFDSERQRAIMERSVEEAVRKRKKSLSIDDLEPVS